jgi:hypothetical protein
MCDPVAPVAAEGNKFLDEKCGDPASAARSAESPSPSIAGPGPLPRSIGNEAAPGEGMRATRSGFE